MKKITIWHNPRCSKSKAALTLLEKFTQDGKIELSVYLYLKEDLSLKQLKLTLDYLKMASPQQWMRKKEPTYQALNCEAVNDEIKLLQAMQENPILIERPTLVNEAQKKAIIGRELERVYEFLS